MRKIIDLDADYMIRYYTSGLLGQGSHGGVYRAKLIKKNNSWFSIFRPYLSKEDLIVKIFDKRVYSFTSELECLMELQEEPHIVHINKICTDHCATKGFIGMEYCRGGDLCDYYLKHHNYPFSERELKILLKQIVKTIDECHSHHIVHGDIKPDNIGLVRKNDISDIRLLDFGSAYKIKYPDDQKQYPSSSFQIYSSPHYIPPEFADNNFLIRERDLIFADMWELGVLCYVLLTGCYPYSGRTKLMWPDLSISTDAKDFISKLLQKIPHERKITYTYFDS